MTALDETDRALLRALARDATQSAGALGRRLGLSQPATWRRIRRLEEAGVIEDDATTGSADSAMDDETMMDGLDEAAVSYQIILTKADKLKPAELTAMEEVTLKQIAKRPAAFPEIIRTSSTKKSGLDDLRDAIAAFTPLILIFGGEGLSWKRLWPIFGATNQMLAGLSLLVLTVYLYRKGRNILFTLIPLIFLIIMTSTAMILSLKDYIKSGNWVLTVLSMLLLSFSAWIILEAINVVRNLKKEDKSVDDLV